MSTPDPNSSNASAFNAEQFLNLQVEDPNSTELLLVPEGEYTAVSEPVDANSFRSFTIGKGERAGQKGVSLDVEWSINDESGALKEYLGRAPKVRQGLMLDTIGGGTSLEMGKGKNVGLGRLREALGQNQTATPWRFSMLGSQVAKIKVKHRLDSNTGKTYAEVSEVTKL